MLFAPLGNGENRRHQPSTGVPCRDGNGSLKVTDQQGRRTSGHHAGPPLAPCQEHPMKESQGRAKAQIFGNSSDAMQPKSMLQYSVGTKPKLVQFLAHLCALHCLYLSDSMTAC